MARDPAPMPPQIQQLADAYHITDVEQIRSILLISSFFFIFFLILLVKVDDCFA